MWHLNEGHAAFVVLQRIRELLEEGLGFDDALDEVRRTTVFTTHTPVPAGHDAFPFHIVETHLAGCWGSLGEHREDFLALGSYDNGSGTLFNMTALALRSSSKVNGVSALHGEVTREMWGPIWPDLAPDARPVESITNGVHLPTWIAAGHEEAVRQARAGLARARRRPRRSGSRCSTSPDKELWEVRTTLRGFLFAFIRERMRLRWTDERVSPPRVVAGGTLLDPHALTIGFARRFTGYKRPELIFHDTGRLQALLERPAAAAADRVRRKGAPGRRQRQARAAGRLPTGDRPGVQRTHRVRRRLRPARGALLRAGVRRLDEQPPQAARGERHERHEGVGQRRAAPEHR